MNSKLDNQAMVMNRRSPSSRKLVLVAVASAALATALVVGIYQMKPQESKRAAPSVAAALLGGRSSESAATPREPPASSSPGSEPGAPLRFAAERCTVPELEQAKGALETVQREKRDLEAQVQALENELGRPGEITKRLNAEEFELTQEDWKELAATAAIKYRIPCHQQAGATNYTQSNLDKLGISPEDGKVLGEAHQRSSDRVWNTVRPLCMDVIGKADVVELIGPSSCTSIIERLAMRSDTKGFFEARRLVGEVNAGTRPMPEAGRKQHPVFEALLAITREAKLFEADLTESFGPDEAKRIIRSMPCVATQR